MKRSLSREETVNVIKIIQDPNSTQHAKDAASRKLVVDYKGVVLKQVKYYYNLRKDVTDKDDLIGAAWKGFFDSLMKYDVSKADEVQFITYATGGVQMAVLGAYRNQVNIRGVEASTFTELMTEDDQESGEDAIMRTRISKTSMLVDVSIAETDAGHVSAGDVPEFIERLRRSGALSIQESILLFVKGGMGTDEGNPLRTAKELGIKQSQIRLETAETRLDAFIFQQNTKKACSTH